MPAINMPPGIGNRGHGPLLRTKLITKLPPTEVGGLAHSVLMTNVIKLAPSSARMSQNMKINVTV